MKIISFKIIILSFIFSSSAIAQDGTPFITHYQDIKSIENQNWSISQDEQNVMLFANRRGIIAFDGHQWNLIKIPHIPFFLKRNPIDNKVYVGAQNNYGYLERDSKGLIKYVSLSGDTSNIGIVSKIIFNDSSMYFYGDQTITRHNLNNPNKIKRWKAKKNKPFTGILCTNKNTFFNVANEGLFRLEKDTLFPIVTGFYTENNEILFSLPYSKNRILVGTDDSKLYTFDGIKYYNYDINDDNYLKESILSDGQVISDSLYAFGTLYGGVEIVSKKTGKIIYTVNYQNGLPDDEIYSLGLDNNNGLWLTHEYGVSRVDFNIPVRNFSTYPGLKGNLLSSTVHNDILYIATNEGVFYLSEIKDFNEAEIWVKKKVKSTVASSTDQTSNTEQQTKTPVKKLFSRLFNKKETEEAKPEKQSQKPTLKTTYKTKYVKSTVSTLKSINYTYEKIKGLNEKCTQLISTPNGIIVASNTGVYVIDKNKSAHIVPGKYINQIQKSNNNEYLIATGSGVGVLSYQKDSWKYEKAYPKFKESAYSVNLINNNLWIGSDNKIIKFNNDSGNIIEYKIETNFPEEFKLDFINDTLFAFLENGIYFYHLDKDSFLSYNINEQQKLILSQNYAWIKTNDWHCLNNNKVWTKQEESYLKMFSDISSINSDNNNNLWIINNNRELYKIDHKKFKVIESSFNVFFNKINNQDGLLFELNELEFDPKNKAIFVQIKAPYYIKQNSTQYQYYVEGLMNDWSKWSTNNEINLLVKPGNYNLFVRAKNIWGNKSEIKSLTFSIKKPFTQTFGFYGIIVILIIASFILISKLRERKLKHDKKVLEQKVKERTIEIQEKAEEIEAQRDEITEQRDEILRQKDEITDSINYASRIQKAVLPLRDHFDRAFSDHFILYKPRDIVSGDFYWIAEDENKLYFTAADCTGHGVPGAFMSMLGISSLNEIFGNENNHLTASRILNLLREKIKFSLHQTGKEGENKDGMDMALCIYHKKKNIIEYAGAYNPLYLIRNGELIEHKADRMPIGIYHIEKESFTNHEIEIQKGDVIYIFSDGYVDQFGGPGQTKFKAANFKKLLLEINEKPMKEQQNILDERFAKWKGDLDQIDDVILIGIRF